MKSFVILLIVACTQQSSTLGPNDLETFRLQILGEWTYSHSLLIERDTAAIAPTRDDCPVYQMSFMKCADSTDLLRFPEIIRKLRRGNLLANIRCETYRRNGESIDTCFPVARPKKDSTWLSIDNYGLRFKSYYAIDYFRNDTMILNECRHIKHNNEWVNARHIYIKSRTDEK